MSALRKKNMWCGNPLGRKKKKSWLNEKEKSNWKVGWVLDKRCRCRRCGIVNSLGDVGVSLVGDRGGCPSCSKKIFVFERKNKKRTVGVSLDRD